MKVPILRLPVPVAFENVMPPRDERPETFRVAAEIPALAVISVPEALVKRRVGKRP